MNRLEVKKAEAIARTLASFPDHPPTTANVRAISRRCSNELFEQNPYQAVRDAILQSIQAGELTGKQQEPKTKAVTPTSDDTDIKQQIAFVESILNEYPKYRGVDSNLRMVATYCQGRPFSADSVRQAISECAASRKLGINSDYRDAFQSFWDQHPEYAMAANEELLARAFDEHIGPDGVFSLQALEDLLRDEVADIRPKLALTLQAQRAASEANELAALREQLTNVKCSLDAYGRKVCSDEKGRSVLHSEYVQRVSSMPLEALRDIRNQKSEIKSLRALDKDALKEIVKADADERRQTLLDSQFARIPDRYVPPGKDEGCGVPWSAQLLRKLPRFEIERLFRVFGADQLNAAIGSKR